MTVGDLMREQLLKGELGADEDDEEEEEEGEGEEKGNGSCMGVLHVCLDGSLLVFLSLLSDVLGLM